MGVRLHKHGPILATMKLDKLKASISKNSKKRNSKIVKELTKRGVSLEDQSQE